MPTSIDHRTNRFRCVLLIAALCSALALACECHQTTYARADHFEVLLEFTPGRGAWPVFELEVSSDGFLRYTGSQHVRRVGEVRREIDDQAAAAVSDALATIDWSAYSDMYSSMADGCQLYRNHQPSVVMYVERDGMARMITVYRGCIFTEEPTPSPARILEVADYISRLLIADVL